MDFESDRPLFGIQVSLFSGGVTLANYLILITSALK